MAPSEKTCYLSCTLKAEVDSAPVCVAAVPSGHGATLAFVFTYGGSFLRLLEAADPWVTAGNASCSGSGFALSDPVPLRIREFQDAAVPRPHLTHACWDEYSGCMYAVVGPAASTDGSAVVQVAEDGDATVVAGHLSEVGRSDGPGLSARFMHCSKIFSDGEGCLYTFDSGGVRRLRLPAVWRSSQPGTASRAAATAMRGGGQRPDRHGQQQQQRPGIDGDVTVGSPAAATGQRMEVTVTTMKRGSPHACLGYDPASRSLVLCSNSAVYRLPVAGLWPDPAAVQEPVLLASMAGRAGAGGVHSDSVGEGARFSAIWDVAVDGRGAAWVLDIVVCPQRGAMRHLVRVDSNGAATTVNVQKWKDDTDSIAVLRNGCLAISGSPAGVISVQLLQLGLTPAGFTSGPAPGTLAADLGELLDRQPDGSADVEVEVGGQVFTAHRSVLTARSPYFRQRLDPGAGFADGCAPRLSLPDADPAAFGAVLRFMYTDSAGPVPPELLQPVGELADRLLLRGLCEQVCSQLLGRVSLENVVGLLLWAEQRGGSYGALLTGLKEWFLRHHNPEDGRDLSDEDVVRLMREAPELGLQLLYRRRVDGA